MTDLTDLSTDVTVSLGGGGFSAQLFKVEIL